MAAFLRVINVLENIDSAIRLQRSALKSRNSARRARFVARSAGEIEVLADASLHPDAVALLNKARSFVTGCEPCSSKTIRKGIRRERAARGGIAAPTAP